MLLPKPEKKKNNKDTIEKELPDNKFDKYS